jgi:aminopeptidase S
MKGFAAKLSSVVLGLLACVTLANGQKEVRRPTASDHFRNQVAAISAGVDNAARRAAITKRLDQLGIKNRLEEFSNGELFGTNIVAELPSKGQKVLMLGAHYDRVKEGSGAVDNASGSTAVLELLAALTENPLKNYSVSAVFFDMEEKGLIGSIKYTKALEKKDLPSVFINFDVFGYGDTLWVGAGDPMVGAAAAIKEAAAVSKFPLQIGPAYPPSDHLSFLRAGVEALSFSLIDSSEIPGILSIFKGQRPEVPPRVMTIIHTLGDKMDKIDAPAVSRAMVVVEQGIRGIDARN